MTAPLHSGHAYRLGTRGRAFEYPPPGSALNYRVEAVLQCSLCRRFSRIKLKKEIPDHACDNRFMANGWSLDPHICPLCKKGEDLETETKGEIMSLSTATPTPVAAKAQRQLYELLDQHFNEDEGRYAPDWDDKRIAEVTFLSIEHVRLTRDSAYGPLKVNEEAEKLRADINSMRDLAASMQSQIKTMDADLVGMQSRLAKLVK